MERHIEISASDQQNDSLKPVRSTGSGLELSQDPCSLGCCKPGDDGRPDASRLGDWPWPLGRRSNGTKDVAAHYAYCRAGSKTPGSDARKKLWTASRRRLQKGTGILGWGFFLGIFYGFFLVFFMVFRSADARVSQSVKQLVGQLVDSRPSGQAVGEPTERSVSQSVGQPTERPVSQSVSQSVSGQR